MVMLAGTIWLQERPATTADPAFQYLTNDSMLLDVYETFDPAGVLSGYRAHVLSPVCEDGKCYEAELDFFWDRLGHFTHFEIDPAKPLTKLDHVPFSTDDYRKLDSILLTQSPSFIHLRRSELVVDPGKDLDGVTGATVKAIKKDMVPGAIYTCYTLWHIANGGITFKIQEYTRQQLQPALIEKMLDAADAREHAFLLEHLDRPYFSQFLEPLLQLADRYDAFFAARLGDQLPEELFTKPEVQQFFRQHFTRLDYLAQRNWMAKLEASGSLEPATAQFLIDQIPTDDPVRTGRIIQLLIEKTPATSQEAWTALFTVLLDREVHLKSETLQQLEPITDTHRRLKKMYKRLKKK